MKDYDVLMFVSAVTAGISVLATVSAAASASRIEKMTCRATERLSTASSVTIERKMLEDAVSEAARNAAETAARQVKNDIVSEVNRQVRDIVNVSKDSVKEAAAAKLQGAIDAIKPEDVAKDAAYIAAKNMAKKLESKVDDYIRVGERKSELPIYIKL